ncbi:hypothetical protein [Martelella sp. FOR1707]
MAIQATVPTQYGENRNCYIRLNNVEASNHGVNAVALFRGFLTEAAFQSGAHYVWEATVEFSADVSQPIWPQAYAALKAQEAFSDAVDV